MCRDVWAKGEIGGMNRKLVWRARIVDVDDLAEVWVLSDIGAKTEYH